MLKQTFNIREVELPLRIQITNMYNSFGNIFRITTFGESHGSAIGVVLDGLPAGLAFDLEKVQSELERRRPGQSIYTSPRNEADIAECLSGVFRGKTTGAPLALLIRNQDARSEDYTPTETIFRPSHADFTYISKYGLRDHRGSGRASARETAVRVAAGAVAAQFLSQVCGAEVMAWVESVGKIKMPESQEVISQKQIESSPVRCPDIHTSRAIEAYILELKESGDSAGGNIICRADSVPPGLGEPLYLKLSAMLAFALFSIPAVKGFELGSGFQGSTMQGSGHNDSFYTDTEGKAATRTNYSGGIQGGISNGSPIIFRVGFKPVSTIALQQKTLNHTLEEVVLEAKGRHDPCVLPRAVPIVEAMTRLVLADAWLMHANSKI